MDFTIDEVIYKNWKGVFSSTQIINMLTHEQVSSAERFREDSSGKRFGVEPRFKTNTDIANYLFSYSHISWNLDSGPNIFFKTRDCLHKFSTIKVLQWLAMLLSFSLVVYQG